ncbi:MAG: HAD family phosphatase [Bacteroidia bacterium]|nr:HAD family phosphatase [Bacteroidia bacterium]
MKAYTIKNIILDLGGVLINLDYLATEKKFIEFGLTNFDQLFTQAKQTSLFDDYETGKITTDLFVQQIINLSNYTLNKNQVMQAWNAMLLDFPLERMELLERLKKKYRLFLLSNTNQLHIESFITILNHGFGYGRFVNAFEKIYYSYQIDLRKPNTTIFKHVLQDRQLLANETLFIDDSAQHIQGALQAGINAQWLNLKTTTLKECLTQLQIDAK